MGNSCLDRSDNPIKSAALFWEHPSFDGLGKYQTKLKRYDVGVMYRGKRTIVTEEELCAALKILRAYRRYKRAKQPSA